MYKNQTIQSYVTSDQLFLFENGQVIFNETRLAQSNMTFHSTVKVDELRVVGAETVANTTVLGQNASFDKMTVDNGSLTNATITNTLSLANGYFQELISKDVQVTNETTVDDQLKSKIINAFSVKSSGLNISDE